MSASAVPAARAERAATLLVAFLLVVVGAAAWWLQLRPTLTVDSEALAALPHRIGPWHAEDVALDQAVEAELRADLNLQRVYVDPTGESVVLYVGYYGTRRGGRPEHTPRGCYTGAGFSIESARRLPAAPTASHAVNEYLVERDGTRQLVHFWYRSYRSAGLLGGFDQNLDRLLGRLLDGRADGALIRLSADVVDGDEVAARSRLLAFGAALDPLLAERWPRETPSPRSR
ncbi:MAG TPA: EpsI family protein [Myxococcota bacterium]|jgi:EpsI family protein|nr:EpsI family protein [Myxococcota bacterium]